MTDHESARRGAQAEQELQLTTEAFDKLKVAMFEELIATSVGQTAKIERLHIALQMLAGVKKALFEVSMNGAVARHALASETGLLRPN